MAVTENPLADSSSAGGEAASMTAPRRRMLTHAGHRRLLALLDNRARFDADARILGLLAERGVDLLPDEPRVEALAVRGWLQDAPQGLTPSAARLRYRRNPLEHVRRINFEITTQCNFQCLHCRNGDLKAVRERDICRLEEAADTFLSLGVRRYDFIGGEVSRYGTGWLELAAHLRDRSAEEAWAEPLAVTLYTNGWWLGMQDFQAAGRRYVDEAAYLRDLANHGVTHILFSIDGPAARHDAWRQSAGLFERVREGIPRVAAAGIAPRLSVVMLPGDGTGYLRPLAEAIYGPHPDSRQRLDEDRFNHFSNFVDAGRASGELRAGRHRLSEVNPDDIRCKAFFRPSPSLRVRADGSLGICPLMVGGEGYGNIHDAPIVELLNRIDETPLYRLHAEGRIGEYLGRLDSQAFPDGFDHLCALRVEVNRVALAAQGEGGSLLRRALGRRGTPWEEAAALLRDADGLVIAAGAGMGVDSRLPDFRGREGFWRAYPALGRPGIDFEQMADPDNFARDPVLAWGFYGHRLKLYRETIPHDGYRILRDLGDAMARGSFVFTSNVDGHFGKAGFPAERIFERHGSIHRLQCSKACCDDIWSADGFEPEVDEANCQLLSPLPACPRCGAVARPHILMFRDRAWVTAPAARQVGRLEAWLREVSSPVFVELGAGENVPTVRRFCEDQRAPLIRINPDRPELPAGRAGIALAAGALDALRRIAAARFG